MSRRKDPKPPRPRPGAHEHDVERSLAGEEGRQAEEITGANLAMDEEFGNEANPESTRLEEVSDGEVDEEPDGPDQRAEDDVDDAFNSGIINRNAG